MSIEQGDDYPGGDDDYPGGEATLVSKGACKAVLAKGYGFKIADCCDTVPDNFTCGLSWDVTDGVNIDLDASAIMLGKNKDLKGKVMGGLGTQGLSHPSTLLCP